MVCDLGQRVRVVASSRQQKPQPPHTFELTTPSWATDSKQARGIKVYPYLYLLKWRQLEAACSITDRRSSYHFLTDMVYPILVKHTKSPKP